MARTKQPARTPEQIRADARAKYHAVLAKAEAAQAAHPKLYLLDEAVSRENAQDGLRSNEGIALPAHEWDWCAKCFEYMARNIEADTACRLAEQGIEPADFGLSF